MHHHCSVGWMTPHTVKECAGRHRLGHTSNILTASSCALVWYVSAFQKHLDFSQILRNRAANSAQSCMSWACIYSSTVAANTMMDSTIDRRAEGENATTVGASYLLAEGDVQASAPHPSPTLAKHQARVGVCDCHQQWIRDLHSSVSDSVYLLHGEARLCSNNNIHWSFNLRHC